jgi:PAS domain-containing protein
MGGFLTTAMEYVRNEYADLSSLPANDIAGFFMEGSFDAMLLVDREGCIECTNSAAIRLLGQPGVAMIGRPIDDVVSLRLYPGIRGQRRQACERDTHFRDVEGQRRQTGVDGVG